MGERKMASVTKSPHQDVLINLPEDAKARKAIPIGAGVLDYFPAALAEIAKVSKAGNDQHNPGQPLHWARGKSTDQYNTIIRHLIQRGTLDSDGTRHSAKAAWRCLALLQEELEREAGFTPEKGVIIGEIGMMAGEPVVEPLKSMLAQKFEQTTEEIEK
jgi:dATP/dGTP diphosphohydrolase, N-terminal